VTLYTLNDNEDRLEDFSLNELTRFIVEAKKKTFASGIKSILSPRLGFKELSFRKNNFSYRDKYFGNTIDIGQEIVWYKKKPIWGMNYRGGMESGYENIREKTFSFLKKALKKVNFSKPFRGPSFLKDEDFQYHNKFTGNVTEFSGNEFIMFKNEKVYSRKYFGGLIIDIR